MRRREGGERKRRESKKARTSRRSVSETDHERLPAYTLWIRQAVGKGGQKVSIQEAKAERPRIWFRLHGWRHAACEWAVNGPPERRAQVGQAKREADGSRGIVKRAAVATHLAMMLRGSSCLADASAGGDRTAGDHFAGNSSSW